VNLNKICNNAYIPKRAIFQLVVTMKSIWQGSISFGLVSIPIRLYSAIERKGIGFRLLHKKDNSTIIYKRFCTKEGKEVKWEDIVKGIEVRKGQFYVVSKEELAKIKPEKTDYIDIVEFVDNSQIDPIYFDSHYYVAPARKKDKAYFLFKEVMKLSGKAAIGRFVMREKEYAAVISSYKKGLLLTTLNYAYEIRDINKLEELAEAPKVSAEELALAKTLIQKLAKPEFEITQFKDTFLEQLKELIVQKEKGKIVAAKLVHRKKEENLITALRASLK
jgi:DNA end-binding protein Ku